MSHHSEPVRFGDLSSGLVKNLERRTSSGASSARCEAIPDREAKVARTAMWSAIEKKIGKRYSRCTFDGFEAETEPQQAVKAAVIDLAKTLPERIAAGGGMLLFGSPGSGKDHLAICALRAAVMAHGLTAEAIDGQQFFSKARDCIGGDTREQDFVALYTKPDILLMSDPLPVGMTHTEFQRSTLWRVFDARYRDEKPIWLTVNVVNREELEDRCGAQLADRMRDGALCLFFNWPTHRRPSNRAG